MIHYLFRSGIPKLRHIRIFSCNSTQTMFAHIWRASFDFHVRSEHSNSELNKTPDRQVTKLLDWSKARKRKSTAVKILSFGLKPSVDTLARKRCFPHYKFRSFCNDSRSTEFLSIPLSLCLMLHTLECLTTKLTMKVSDRYEEYIANAICH